MSYNTRRTERGAAGRGASPTTQVNYHQQPARTAVAANNAAAQQRTASGYSTAPQPPAAYNSAAQPAYSTQQPAYSTAPPLPKTAPQQAKPAVSTPPPPVKQEPVTPQSTPKVDAQENGEEPQDKSVPFWKRKPYMKVSNRVKKARQNAKLRRLLNPKNALTFLNELKPGAAKFSVTEEPGWGFAAICEIDGKTFTGHGMTMSNARIQASEQALKHLLMEQLAKSPAPTTTEVKEEEEDDKGEEMETDDKQEEGAEPKPKKRRVQQEDDVPWGGLAAFALHKLFTEWQKEGVQVPSMDKYEEEMSEDAYYSRRPMPDFFPPHAGPRGSGFGPGPRPFPPVRGRGFGPGPFPGPRGLPFAMGRRPPPAANYLNKSPRATMPALPGNAMPMKKIPEDANQRHPVMLLNQLKPNVIYNEVREGLPPNVMFIITVNIDGKEYTGRAKNKKEAKKIAAQAALVPLGITCQSVPATN